MENTYSVYMHINKINGKRYVGQTKQKLQYRWRDGKGYLKNQPVFANAIKKYGWENFEHIIVRKNLTLDEANKIESELIKKYNTTSHANGYNILYGGGNRSLPDFVRHKISEAHKGIIIGPCSEERKRKIGDANRGRIYTEEMRKNMSEGQKGKKYSDEYKKMKSEQLKEQWRTGERKPALQPKLRKPVIATNIITGEQIGFESVQAAAKMLNVPRTGISSVLSNHQKTAHGYRFEAGVI